MYSTNLLWLIWKSPKKRQRYKIGELTRESNPDGDFNYIFKYTNPELDDAKSAGFDFFPGFDEHKMEYRSGKLFENIKTRLLNRRRPDFLDLLNKYKVELS